MCRLERKLSGEMWDVHTVFLVDRYMEEAVKVAKEAVSLGEVSNE